MKSYTHLKSENQNKNTLEIHKQSVVDILNKINDEDQKIANLFREAIPTIRNTIDLTLKSIKSGGRIFYVGAGTSGRLGVLDASEMPPTYSVSKDVFSTTRSKFSATAVIGSYAVHCSRVDFFKKT